MSNLNDIFFTPAANQELTYDQVLEDVQRYFAENHASTIAEAGEGNAERATSLLKELMEHYIVKRKYSSRPPAHRSQYSWYPFPQSTGPSDAEYPCRFLWSTPLHFSFHPEDANTA